jgi:hypothetical protein
LFFVFCNRKSYFSTVFKADIILIFSGDNGLVKFILVYFNDNTILWLGDLGTLKKSIFHALGNQNFGNFSKPASTVRYVAGASTHVSTYSHGTPKGFSSESSVQILIL